MSLANGTKDNDHVEALYAHAFRCMPAIVPMRLRRIQEAFSSFATAWRASAQELATRLDDPALASLLSIKTAIAPEEEWEKLLRQHIRVFLANDNGYPALLREIAQPPALLYVRCDNLSPFQTPRPTAAIVGSRKMSGYGKIAAHTISAELAAAGVIVVSGLAIGIDAAAHEATLGSGTPTWAVLGSGLSRIYPPRNQQLASRILAEGGTLISEYHPTQPAGPHTFPQRNRIIAGLSRLTIVVEAAERSGALITARHALEANRDVAAVPGDIFALQSSGTNALLRQGATLIRNAGDALELLGVTLETSTQDPAAATPTLDKSDETAHHILRCLASPRTVEALQTYTELPASLLQQKLTLLELRGLVRKSGGMFYRK